MTELAATEPRREPTRAFFASRSSCARPRRTDSGLVPQHIPVNPVNSLILLSARKLDRCRSRWESGSLLLQEHARPAVNTSNCFPPLLQGPSVQRRIAIKRYGDDLRLICSSAVGVKYDF
jgi:hypothetical protein